MTKKSWLVFGILCAVILGGFIWLAQGNKVDVSDVNTDQVQVAGDKNGNIADQLLGNPEAKVTVIEYGDYQCPGCATAAPVLKEVAEKHKDNIRFVFRNKPLTNIHPNALSSAAAAEAAGLQGQFWRMHDALYANQQAWRNLSGKDRTDYYVTMANSIGLDGEKLKTDLSSPQISQKIRFDSALADKQKVTGTPAIFVNGENVSDKYFKDGELVSGGTEGASQVWTSAEAFSSLIIVPALRDAGVTIE